MYVIEKWIICKLSENVTLSHLRSKGKASVCIVYCAGYGC